MTRIHQTISRRIVGLGVALIAVGFGSLGIAQAASTIVDSHGFESPWFDTTFGPGGPGTGAGQIEGQTPSTFNGTWLRTKGIGLSTANVQNSVVKTGSQALKVDRAANSDDRWAVPVDGYPGLNQRYICIDWDMRVQQTVGPTGTFGPFFGVEAYDDNASTLGLLGSLGVDASTGDVLYQIQDSGFLTETGTTVAFGAWNNFHIQLDYLTHTYKFGMNGVVLGSTGFVDHNNIPGGLDEFTDADIAALAAAGDAASLALGGTAYFDNFKVIESATPCFPEIPEPTAGLLAMLGATALGVVRRRK